MPLDTASTYSQTLLRTDGRRWNELRNLTLALSTSPTSSDGSSLLTMGNTTVLCTVTGPRESKTSRDNTAATIDCEVHIAAFAAGDRRVRKRGDKRVAELQSSITGAFQGHVFANLYPRSTISIALHVLSLDGALLAACLNAASLALVDAGVPMPSLLAAVSSGVIVDDGTGRAEPLLDLNNSEEQELAFLTVGTVGGLGWQEDRVSVLVMETRCQVGDGSRLEGMLAVGVDGCKRVRELMEETIRRHGVKVLRSRKG
jgi:exosome complex component RRP41